MPKKSSNKSVEVNTTMPAPVPESADPLDVVVSSQDEAQVTQKKKQKKSKSVAPLAEEAPAPLVNEVVDASLSTPAPVVVESSVDSETPVDESSPSGQELVSSVMTEFSTALQMLTAQLTTLRTEFKNMSRVVSREMKTAAKSARGKGRRTGGNKQPSGFVKPTLITDELATFLGRDKGTEMARTEVTREINQYIRDHNLQDSTNGRHINPDNKLAKLLNYDSAETLTYFNLQKYLSHHFVKQTEQPSA
jgi:chromatin remodeling complex protein RSC6